MKLGSAANTTPDQARKAARDVLARARLGNDPARNRQNRRQSLSFAQLAGSFLSEHFDVKRRSSTRMH
jgi:hypothetical protein